MENAVPKNILLVDDDPGFLLTLANNLKKGYENCCVLTAGNGVHALKLLECDQVDLVVTDLNMPVMDGFDLILHMKEKYPSIPVIVMSSYLYPGLEATLKSLNVSQCIDKSNAEALGGMISKSWPEGERQSGGYDSPAPAAVRD
jgi:CheY-like chemotaxis protein